MNFEKLKINSFDSANSKVTTVQRVNFLIKTTDAYRSPLICLPLQYQLLQIARKHFKHLSLNFADKRNLDGEIDLLKGEINLCDREGLVAVNSLFVWVLSGVKSEELETTNLHSTHLLFSRDIPGHERSVSRI